MEEKLEQVFLENEAFFKKNKKKLFRDINPLNWSVKRILITLGVFYALFLPIYIYIGLQPAYGETSIVGTLEIPSINLNSEVIAAKIENNELLTPDYSIASYSPNKNKEFLYAHSSTVFQNLKDINVRDKIIYNSEQYVILNKEYQKLEDVSMRKILAPTETETIILMTCAGEEVGNDFTERLLITAQKL